MDDVLIPQVSASNGPTGTSSDAQICGETRGENAGKRPERLLLPGLVSRRLLPGRKRIRRQHHPSLAVRRVRVTSSEPSMPEQTPRRFRRSPTPVTSPKAQPTAPPRSARLCPEVRHGSRGRQLHLSGRRIRYELASGGSGVISTDEVDWNSTTNINNQRGVRTMLPAGTHRNLGILNSSQPSDLSRQRKAGAVFLRLPRSNLNLKHN